MNNQNIPLEMPANPVKFYDIYAPVALDKPYSWWLICAVAALCLIAMLLLLFFYKKRKKAVAPAAPYWKTILQQLETLAPLQQQNAPLYIEKIHSLLRHYLESRFELRPTKQTTEEFFHCEELLKNKEIKQFQQELRLLFDQADLIKFAQLTPTKEQLQQMEQSIRLFIEQSAPQSTPAGKKEAP